MASMSDYIKVDVRRLRRPSTDSNMSNESSASSSSTDTPTAPIKTTIPPSQQADKLNSAEQFGISTEEGLLILYEDIEKEVRRMKADFSSRKFLYWLKKSLSFASELSKMRWPSVLFMTTQALAHFIVAFALRVNNLATNWVGFQGFILGLLLILNLTVNLWDTKLRFKELLMKTEQLMNLVYQCAHDEHLLKQWKLHNWSSADIKTLFAPKSPCVHQTLTYRDDTCFNIPDFLLVRGDIIHLYPGDRAPGNCISLKSLKSPTGVEEESKVKLMEGQVFSQKEQKDDQYPSSDAQENQTSADESKLRQFDRVKAKRALKGSDFLMLSTPYIKSLRISLQRSHKRPVNSVEKECFIVSRKYFETFVIPSVFIMSTVVTAIHYGYLDLTDSDQKIKTISIAYLLLRPSLTIMPFLPWMFPCFWLAVNAYGSARLLCCGEAQQTRNQLNNLPNSQSCSPTWNNQKTSNTLINSCVSSNLLATPTAAGSSENKNDDEELHAFSNNIRFASIFGLFIDLIRGEGGHVWRSSSLLQVLGCLTSLCCIDKVGILSWSNPTPEKVFVLANNQQESRARFQIELQLDHSDETSAHTNAADNSSSRDNLAPMTTFGQIRKEDDEIISADRRAQSMMNQCTPEVLDVSYSLNSSYRVSTSPLIGQPQFDDLNWSKYSHNLKPLGLAIMLNNCCQGSFGDYFRFYKHISHVSLRRCNLTPVVKRRCLCALSKLIGFSHEAVDNYKYISQVGIYKLRDTTVIGSEKFVSSSDNPARLKLPFPNMICNVHQDTTTGGHQAFSQGTADVIIDTCIDYWDGKQLLPLDDHIRKKIMDFYHRTSLTSYCSAFAYTPLLKVHALKDRFIELSPGRTKFKPELRRMFNEYHEEYLNKQVIDLPDKQPSDMDTYFSHETATINAVNLNSADIYSESGNLTNSPVILREPEHFHKQIRRHLSVEALMGTKPGIMSQDPTKVTSAELDETLDELTDQVFVGMVAMQYQACPDFVALVEQLELACIRFVHFSKENELRSRVFSEKMGLESGWNCHISLQSEQVGMKNDLELSECEQPIDEVPKYLGSTRPPARLASMLGTDDDATSTNNSVLSESLTIHSCKSLPSLVMRLTSSLITRLSSTVSPDHQAVNKTNPMMAESSEARLADTDDTEAHLEPCPTYATDMTELNQEETTRDEGFDSLTFDMSNRAKLPKGIENIRPHLETVDNVPLQVSLFTDCNPKLAQEMIEIMQEYGEIVCVIGSSASTHNTAIFLQANASIAIQPLIPESCGHLSTTANTSGSNFKTPREGKRRESKSANERKKQEFLEGNRAQSARQNNPRDRLGIRQSETYSSKSGKNRPLIKVSTTSTSSSSSSSSSTSYSSSSEDEGFVETQSLDMDRKSSLLLKELPDPRALASKLASLPCSYSYNRKDQVNLYSLIMEARHFTFKMKNTFVCMICFALSISSAQFLASILFLPPMLSSGLTIWLTVVVVPLMSFCLMNTTIDSQVMKIAVGKNLQLKPENITFFVICYLIKFIPSIIVVVLSFGLIIAHSCQLTGFGTSSVGPCWMFTYVKHNNTTSQDEDANEDLLWSTHLLTAQVCVAFLLVLYFVVISSGFVHRSHLPWQKSPTENHLWVFISLLLIFGQLFYNHLVLQVNLGSAAESYKFLRTLPLHIWFISFSWPVIAIVVNVFVKRAEVKATIRQQRRARFDFNTKLGMNSPF